MEFLDALTQPQALIFAGVLGIITAIATNLVTYVLTMRGQDKRRWDNRQLDVYADYSRAVKKLTFLALRAAVGRGMLCYIAPLPADESAAALVVAKQDRVTVTKPFYHLAAGTTLLVIRCW